MQEFNIIEKYFMPLTLDRAEAGGLEDDGAVLSIPAGYELAVSSDTLNAGTHFFTDSPPAMIAHKALRSNLSDLAAMGAAPYAYQLNIAFPEKPDADWLAAFTDALLLDQKTYGIFCSGGDTTSIKGGHLSISITVMGLVKCGKSWRRGGAHDGDTLALSDNIGDAWVGLQVLRGALSTDDDSYFIERYYKPPVKFHESAHIHAAVDISDGAIADIEHICRASGLGVNIDLNRVPFSKQAQKLIDNGAVSPQDLLTGGDDYVLAMAIARGAAHDFYDIAQLEKNVQGVRVFNDGRIIDINRKGWQHF